MKMAAENEKQELIPAAEAAKTLGTTPLGVLMHIKRGLLDGEEVDGAWQITRESLETFQRECMGEKIQFCRSGCASKKGSCGSCA